MDVNSDEKLILIDADGVLLNWIDAFVNWAIEERGLELKPDYRDHYLAEDKFVGFSREEHGRDLIHEFNRTEHIRSLEAIPEAQKYVKRLASHRYKFHVITSIQNLPQIVERRSDNLRDLYGDVFTKISCINYDQTKEAVLSTYTNTQQWWIEDHPKNAKLGYDLGLRSILINYNYNQSFEHPGILRVDDWEQLYNLIKEF